MVDRFVIDNSVIMAWCFEDETSPYAEQVLDRLSEATAIVPTIWPLEVVNVLLVAERRRRLNPADSIRFLDLLVHLPIEVEEESPKQTMRELLDLGRVGNISSYDASYLALALKTGCPIATLDSRILKVAKDLRVKILN